MLAHCLRIGYITVLYHKFVSSDHFLRTITRKHFNSIQVSLALNLWLFQAHTTCNLLYAITNSTSSNKHLLASPQKVEYLEIHTKDFFLRSHHRKCEKPECTWKLYFKDSHSVERLACTRNNKRTFSIKTALTLSLVLHNIISSLN